MNKKTGLSMYSKKQKTSSCLKIQTPQKDRDRLPPVPAASLPNNLAELIICSPGCGIRSFGYQFQFCRQFRQKAAPATYNR